MARKRRQPAAALAPVVEEGPEQADENAEPNVDPGPRAKHEHQDGGDRVARILEALEEEVNARIKSILDAADDAAYALRNELKIQLLKLPKKVRTMPLLEFQRSFEGNIKAAVVDDIRKRLQQAAVDIPGDDGNVAAGDAAPNGGTDNAAGGSSGERLAPEGAAAGSQQVQQPVGTLLVARTTRRRGGAAAAADAGTAVRRSARSRVAATPAAATKASNMPAVPPGTASRLPNHGEVFYSKNGSPLGTYDQPEGGRRGALATPMVDGGGSGVAAAAAAAAPGAITIIKRQGGRGARTQNASAALVITTQDGRQVTVDGAGGLRSVPAAQRKEVEEHLLALQRLAATALKK